MKQLVLLVLVQLLGFNVAAAEMHSISDFEDDAAFNQAMQDLYHNCRENLGGSNSECSFNAVNANTGYVFSVSPTNVTNPDNSVQEVVTVFTGFQNGETSSATGTYTLYGEDGKSFESGPLSPRENVTVSWGIEPTLDEPSVGDE